MGEKIFEVEHKPGEEIVFRVRTAKLPVSSESVRRHFWAAHKEGLLALRELIDTAVEWIEEVEKPTTAEEQKRRKVKVE